MRFNLVHPLFTLSKKARHRQATGVAMRENQHPDRRRSLAIICKNLVVAVAIVALVFAFFVDNTFNRRVRDGRGLNLTLLGKLVGAAVICLIIGVCLAAICRRRANSDE